MTAAMIMAAGRGERMRPLSEHTPKPLLKAGGKPLIVWQIEALARAGVTRIVINVSAHADQIVAALGDGARLGVAIAYSHEPQPLENAGGIATALPLLPPGPLITVAADVWTTYDYRRLAAHAARMAANPALPRAHLVLVPNPAYHPQGDFGLADGRVVETAPRLTYAAIGIHDTALFAVIPPHTWQPMRPLWQRWIAAGEVSGERYDGPWANVGTPADLAALNAAISSS
jgi:MurNAc alpha-1-phosphate uridylyltransferase